MQLTPLQQRVTDAIRLNCQMADVLRSIRSHAASPGSNPTVEFLFQETQGIDFDRLDWSDLSTTERTILRFAWEFVHRTACPLPLHCT